jgi:hypothetical protein
MNEQPKRTSDSTTRLPPVQASTTGEEALLDTSKSLSSQLNAIAGSAVKLTARQTESAKISKVSLPRAFTALGNLVYSSNKHRHDFPEIFHELDDLHAQIQDLESQSRMRPTGEKFIDRAKAAAASVKDRATTTARHLQISRLLAQLGKASYSHYLKRNLLTQRSPSSGISVRVYLPIFPTRRLQNSSKPSNE